MSDPILTLTLGVVVGHGTSGPLHQPIGEGRGLLAQRYGRYVGGTVDLVLTSAPTGKTMPVYRRGHHQTGSRSPAGGPQIGRIQAGAGLGRVLNGCAALLRPGGLAAVVFSRDPAQRSWLSGEPD